MTFNSIKSFYRNKTILITGAASGIGRAFAEKISAYGVTLILWDLNPDTLHDIRDHLHKTTEVLVTGIDVTDAKSIENEAEQIIRGSFVPDIIVNCAGITSGKLFVEHTSRDIEQIMRINATGSMLVAHAFLPKMIERGSGHIVNLASASGYFGNPRLSVYSASKSAVIGWSESLRLELKEQNSGVSVTCVIPSYVSTGLFEGVEAPFMVPILKTETLVNKMIKGIRNSRFKIQAPFMVRLAPALKALLPVFAFDWLASKVFRVYRAMDTFEGRIGDSESRADTENDNTDKESSGQEKSPEEVQEKEQPRKISNKRGSD